MVDRINSTLGVRQALVAGPVRAVAGAHLSSRDGPMRPAVSCQTMLTV